MTRECRVICLACAALARGPHLSIENRYRWAVRCVCGGVQPGQIGALRAEMWAPEIAEMHKALAALEQQ